MPKKVTETATISADAAAAAKSSGRMLMQFISPGWGSSGYYSSDVLEQAAADQVIPAGTHMYADHPTDTEHYDRPERSIKDLMAVVTEDARLATDSDDAETGALVGEVQVVPAWRDLVESVKDAIGVSIRGSATDIVEGEAEGRRGGIIEGLVAPVMSVDFVTRAGRGGRVLSVLESARANHRALDRGVSEATVNDTREALQTAVRDAYGGEDVWVWVRDFDDTTVWFEVESGDDAGVYGQAYTSDGGADSGAVSLTGDRTEVRVVTTYVPATRPDTTTKESEEDTMPNIEESRLRELEEAHGRVPTLESERDTAVSERDQARRDLAVERATSRARTLLNESEHVFTPLEARALLVDLPLVEAEQDGNQVHVLDETEFATRITDAVKESAATLGASTSGVHGFGASTSTGTGDDVTESGAPTHTPWGRPINEQKGA